MPVYRSALVTGASAGIGAAMARELASRGADLTLVARRGELLERLAGELRERHRVAVDALPADLTEPAGLRRVEERLRDGDRSVELLVNNAGFPTTGDFARLPVDREEEEVRLNVLAVLRLTHAALPRMLERRHGGILNVSSMAGNQPLPGGATYAASKAYVTTFSESLHGEVRGSGVHVTVVCPGFTDTPGAPRPRSLAGAVWVRPELVARTAIDAVERGTAVCVPGLHWRTLRVVTGALPRWVVRELAARARPLA